MSYPLPAAQEALYSLLNNDSTLGALVTGVYDDVPDDSALPYVVIARADVALLPASADALWQVRFEVQAYSRNAGKKQLQMIVARLHALLHEASPSVSELSTVSVRVTRERSETLRDVQTQRAVLECGWIIQA